MRIIGPSSLSTPRLTLNWLLSLSLCLSVSPSLRLSVSPSLRLSVSPSLCLSLCPSISLYVSFCSCLLAWREGETWSAALLSLVRGQISLLLPMDGPAQAQGSWSCGVNCPSFYVALQSTYKPVEFNLERIAINLWRNCLVRARVSRWGLLWLRWEQCFLDDVGFWQHPSSQNANNKWKSHTGIWRCLIRGLDLDLHIAWCLDAVFPLEKAYRSPYRFAYRRAYRSRTSRHKCLATPQSDWFVGALPLDTLGMLFDWIMPTWKLDRGNWNFYLESSWLVCDLPMGLQDQESQNNWSDSKWVKHDLSFHKTASTPSLVCLSARKEGSTERVILMSTTQSSTSSVRKSKTSKSLCSWASREAEHQRATVVYLHNTHHLTQVRGGREASGHRQERLSGPRESDSKMGL